jgi:hypothetical protein
MIVRFYPELNIKLRECNDWIFTIIPNITIERDTPEYWFYFDWLIFSLKISIRKSYCSSCLYNDYEHCHDCQPDLDNAINYRHK